MHRTIHRSWICLIQLIEIFYSIQDMSAEVATTHFKYNDILPFVGQSSIQDGTLTKLACSSRCFRNYDCFAFEFHEAGSYCTLVLHHSDRDIGNGIQQLYQRTRECSNKYQYVWQYDICIKATSEFRSWTDAEDYCQKEGGHLMSLESAEKQSLVIKILETHSELTGSIDWWVGATDMETEGHFKWTNGREFGFTSWGNKQPDNGGVVSDLNIGGLFKDPTWK